MAQKLQQMKNPWGAQAAYSGSGFEAQRSDLFTIDFSLSLAAIRIILERATGSNDTALAAQAANFLSTYPTNEEMPFFANAVEFPMASVQSNNVKRHDVPVPYPGLEEPIGQIAITFIQDAPLVGVERSKILTFLRAWRAVVRGGRAGQSVNELQMSLMEASRNGDSLVPGFRHNFTINLWRGELPAQFSDSFVFIPFRAGIGLGLGFSDGMEDMPEGSLELAGQWNVTRGWLSGMQLGALRQAQSGILEVRAIFQAEAITEAGPGRAVVGNLRYLSPITGEQF